MASQTKIKVFTDIPSEGVLQDIIADYKRSGLYETLWTRQSDGRFRLEIYSAAPVMPDYGMMTSPISGHALRRG